MEVIHSVVGEVIKDVIRVGCSCVLGETDTAGHIGSEPDLVKEHGACCDIFQGCFCRVVRVDTVCLDHIGEVTKEHSSGLIRTTCTACRQVVGHVDDTSVLCCKGQVSDGCFTGAHTVCGNEGHTDLHGGPAGGRSSIAGTADDGRHVNALPEGFADCCLKGLSLLLREELLDVDDELGLKVVGEFLVTGKDTDVTVVGKSRMGLDHVFLNDGASGHCVVDNVEILVDGFRSNFLAETLLQGLVGHVHGHDYGSADIIPHLLHGSIVDEVQVITLNEGSGAGDFIGHQLTLTHRDTAKVAAVRVVHGDSTCSFDLLVLGHELLLTGRLLKTIEFIEFCSSGCNILFGELLLE